MPTCRAARRSENPRIGGGTVAQRFIVSNRPLGFCVARQRTSGVTIATPSLAAATSLKQYDMVHRRLGWIVASMDPRHRGAIPPVIAVLGPARICSRKDTVPRPIGCGRCLDLTRHARARSLVIAVMVFGNVKKHPIVPVHPAAELWADRSVRTCLGSCIASGLACR